MGRKGVWCPATQGPDPRPYLPSLSSHVGDSLLPGLGPSGRKEFVYPRRSRVLFITVVPLVGDRRE